FRVEVDAGVTRETIEQALKLHGMGYYKKGPIVRGTFGFQISADAQNFASSRPLRHSASIIGVRLHSADERYVAQFSVEGFTLSRLQPYDSWESLVEEGRRMWAAYRECARPVAIRRVATRFINDLQLPYREGDQFERFLTLMPKFSNQVPQLISSFLQRFEIHDEECGATVILTFALDRSTHGPNVPVILDIDAFKEQEIGVEDDAAWALLGKLRSLKNRF